MRVAQLLVNGQQALFFQEFLKLRRDLNSPLFFILPNRNLNGIADILTDLGTNCLEHAEHMLRQAVFDEGTGEGYTVESGFYRDPAFGAELSFNIKWKRHIGSAAIALFDPCGEFVFLHAGNLIMLQVQSLMNRRAVLKLGVGVGLLGGAGLAGYQFWPPSPSRKLDSVDTLARRFYASLDSNQKAEACVDYDHPLRQYHNRGVWGGGRSVLFGFSHEQRQVLTDLLYAGLSSDGRRRIPDEYFAQWTGVEALRVLVCGEPASPPYQMIFTGSHLNLRLGGKSREGAAFGGPQVYGDQRGNEQVGLPGNLYRGQFLLGQRILRSLDEGRQKLAVLDEAPVQTQIELQGKRGTFPGIPVSELSEGTKALVREVVEHIFSTYSPEDVAYARECLDANGGIDALFLSYYRRGEDGDIPEAQVFRLEGPAAVFYFRGYPHVHAFLNIAMDGDAPLSVGEPLGTNPAWLDHAGVKMLFETALRAQTGSDLAYYNEKSIAGRLRPGTIRSGDIYSLESWQEAAAVAEVRGSNLSAGLQAALREQGVPLDLAKAYKVASPP